MRRREGIRKYEEDQDDHQYVKKTLFFVFRREKKKGKRQTLQKQQTGPLRFLRVWLWLKLVVRHPSHELEWSLT